MRLHQKTNSDAGISKKTTESFVFAGSRYIVEAPEKQNIITIKGKKIKI